MPAKKVYLSLGSNLGDRKQNLANAIARLEAEGVRLTAKSSLYETEPQDVREQPWFLNMVVACETNYFPLQLLAATQRIEGELGRRRAGVVRRGPRSIDIDILLFGDSAINTPRLVVPHPRMLERRFVLEPLLEIAPDLRHPITKELISKHVPGVSMQKLRRLAEV